MIIFERDVTVATFCNLMADHPAGVAIVTTRVGAQPVGLVVTSLASYAAQPPSVMFAVAEESRSHDALAAGEPFGVHFLSERQIRLAKTFAGKGGAKFADVAWSWDQEVPRIHHVRVYLRCEQEAIFRHLDHSIVIGRLVSLARESPLTRPLVYRGRSMSWTVVSASDDGQRTTRREQRGEPE